MRIHFQRYNGSRRSNGFSLIEVMIAVIVLATGLLALAALQINLTQSSADAKARSRMATLLTGIIDSQRAASFGSVAALSGSAGQCTTTSPTTIQTMICSTQSDSGVSGISVSSQVTEYYGAPGTSSFSSDSSTVAGLSVYGDYKRVDMTATWTDSSGNSRSLGATTLISNLSLNGGSTTVLNTNLLNSANLTPVVHETNPANTAGVIPIAIGNNTDTAATNPKPTVNSSSGANSVTFTTLTYTSGVNDSSSTSTIQKRVETEVAECVCQGSSTNPFATGSFEGENVFRPTYWNGTQYTSPSTVSGGTPSSSASTSITQSTECNICCRDHNDTGISTGVKFDSVTGDTNRYKVTKSGSTITTPVSLATSGGNFVVANVTSDAYLDACRMIRVDGVWRVATDIEASHLGLIVTNDENGSSTNPATPASSYETLYETFVVAAVKQYLLSALPSAGSPEWSAFLSGTIAPIFTTDAPNVPSTNPVTADTAGTYRYLHSHGLYIDHLETDAITKLNAVESSTCPTNSSSFPTCLLAYLPFNTINLTNLATWTDASDASGTSEGASPHLSLGSTINTGSTTTCATGTFYRGCVTGLKTGNAYAIATIGHSNSGIAASIPVSTYENLASHDLTASQQFTVSGGATSDLMYGQLSGPNLTPTGWSSVQNFPTSTLNKAINPTLTWAISTTASGNCSANSAKNASTPNPYSCTSTTSYVTPTTITVTGYNQSVSSAATSSKDPCSLGGSSKNKTYPIPGIVCYTVSAVSISTDSAATNFIDCVNKGGSNCFSITSPYTVSNTKKTSESTAITIASKSGNPNVTLSNTYLNVTFIANGSALGTVDTSTCAASKAPTISTPTSCN